ncbi:hypothetical protein FKM82_012940 [Ascaphus truei]
MCHTILNVLWQLDLRDVTLLSIRCKVALVTFRSKLQRLRESSSFSRRFLFCRNKNTKMTLPRNFKKGVYIIFKIIFHTTPCLSWTRNSKSTFRVVELYAAV